MQGFTGVAPCREAPRSPGCTERSVPIRRRAVRSRASAGAHPVPLVQECSVHNWATPLRCDARTDELTRDLVVALGKFDAMHIGHRSLAVKASEDGSQPVLLSFSGMAQVLGWPVKLPLVAGPDRPRVLSSWSEHCNGRVPRQRMVPFHEIRSMSPEQFVSVLAKQLGAAGVVAGRNYRFGYKAAGDATALQELGAKYGMRVHILDLVSDAAPQGSGTVTVADGETDTQVSSSNIRELLSTCQVHTVHRLLGRHYRLVSLLSHTSLQPSQLNGHWQVSSWDGHVPTTTFLNQPPGPGRYKVQAHVVPIDKHSGLESGSYPVLPSMGQAGLSFWEDEEAPVQLPADPADLVLPSGRIMNGNGSSMVSQLAGARQLRASSPPSLGTSSASSSSQPEWCTLEVTPDGLQMAECAHLVSSVSECLVRGQAVYLVLDFEEAV